MLQDARLAIRALRLTSIVSLVAVLSLALGPHEARRFARVGDSGASCGAATNPCRLAAEAVFSDVSARSLRRFSRPNLHPPTLARPARHGNFSSRLEIAFREQASLSILKLRSRKACELACELPRAVSFSG